MIASSVKQVQSGEMHRQPRIGDISKLIAFWAAVLNE
jgi:hypothetical protein